MRLYVVQLCQSLEAIVAELRRRVCGIVQSCYIEASRSHVCFTGVHGGRGNVDWPVISVQESNLAACVEVIGSSSVVLCLKLSSISLFEIWSALVHARQMVT